MQSESEANSVAAIVSADQVSDTLASIHRAGYGHRTRLIRAENDNLTHTLFQRSLSSDQVLLVVQAAQSRGAVLALLNRAGIVDVRCFEEQDSPSTLLSIDITRFSSAKRRSKRPDNVPAVE
jgi:hypothetical protein